MKILNILPYSPVPPHFGGALRIYHLLKAMVKRNDVTIICYGDGENEAAIRREFGTDIRDVIMVPPPPRLHGRLKRWGQLSATIRGRSATSQAFHSPDMQSAITSILAREQFDCIQMENYVLGTFDLSDSRAVRILDAQNVEYDSVHRMAVASPSPLRRWFYEREARSIRKEETGIYRMQNAILLTSERDRALLEQEVTGVPKFVVPNGVDIEYFSPGRESAEPLSLVFTGSMNYYPNVDGIEYFLQEILPLIRREVQHVRVYVVGNSPPKSVFQFQSEDVIVAGGVPDVRPFVDRAAVYIVPLRMGGGTRLKVLEALAMRKPVVTTSIGCEGIEVRHNESVLVADTPADFASGVIELLRNKALAERLQRNGYEVVRSGYTWSAVGERLEEAYAALLGAGVVRLDRIR